MIIELLSIGDPYAFGQFLPHVQIATMNEYAVSRLFRRLPSRTSGRNIGLVSSARHTTLLGPGDFDIVLFPVEAQQDLAPEGVL